MDHGVVVEWRYVTPKMAKDLLASSRGNRRLRQQGVIEYYEAMKADAFCYNNGDTIRLDSDGNVLDGQHRLSALVMYGKPMWMLFVLNVHKDAMRTIDRNYRRSVAEHLVFEEVFSDLFFAQLAVPIATLMIFAFSKNYRTTPTAFQVRSIIVGNIEHFEWFEQVSRGKRGKFLAFIGAALIVAHADPEARERVEQVAQEYKDGGPHEAYSASWYMEQWWLAKNFQASLIPARIALVQKYLHVIQLDCAGERRPPRDLGVTPNAFHAFERYWAESIEALGISAPAPKAPRKKKGKK